MEINKTYNLSLDDNEFAILYIVLSNVNVHTVSQMSGISPTDILTFRKMLEMITGSKLGE